MKSRCSNINDPDYMDYGGRDIVVCKRWRDSFKLFCKDMGKRPSMSYTLDREDNDGDYDPLNCKWSTKREQACNRRDNAKVPGVNWDKREASWIVRISFKGKRESLGYFKDWFEAVCAIKSFIIKQEKYL